MKPNPKNAYDLIQISERQMTKRPLTRPLGTSTQTIAVIQFKVMILFTKCVINLLPVSQMEEDYPISLPSSHFTVLVPNVPKPMMYPTRFKMKDSRLYCHGHISYSVDMTIKN